MEDTTLLRSHSTMKLVRTTDRIIPQKRQEKSTFVIGNDVEEKRLKVIIEGLEARVEELLGIEVSNEELRLKRSSYRAAAREADIKTQQVTQENEDLAFENKTLWEASNKIESEVVAIRGREGVTVAKLSQAEDALNSMKPQLNEALKSRDTAMKQSDTYGKSLSSLEALYTQSEANVKVLQDRLANAEPVLRDKINALSTELESEKKKVRLLGDATKVSEASLAEIQELTKELEGSREAIEELSIALGQKSKEYKFLDTVIIKVKDEYSTLLNEYNNIKEQLEEVRFVAPSMLPIRNSTANAKRSRLGNGKPTLLKVGT